MEFSYLIIQWYRKNKRDLPWRHTSDPYRIWVSEVILQQTRVDQGLDYYERFISRFPDIESLAMAREEEVMKIWQGLGYYSRARNMLLAAKTVRSDFQSVFPVSYEDIRRLSGIGDYSASAISSIAYGGPHPVIDGNVMRVVARYAGIREPVNAAPGKKLVKKFLDQHLDRSNPGIFNQAVMELGALVCKPRQPACEHCPLAGNCLAFRQGLVSQLPVMNKPKPLKTRYFHYIVIINKEENDLSLWFKKRTGEDIWKNLYDFPLVEADRELSAEEVQNSEEWKRISYQHVLKIKSVTGPQRYLLTHRELRVKFFLVESGDYFHPEFIKTRFSSHHNYPVPRLIENYLKKIDP
jgi:A/G-specific adenine glycosylase